MSKSPTEQSCCVVGSISPFCDHRTLTSLFSFLFLCFFTKFIYIETLKKVQESLRMTRKNKINACTNNSVIDLWNSLGIEIYVKHECVQYYGMVRKIDLTCQTNKVDKKSIKF